ncbi:MAG TPA: DUF4282 domain-containing protein [Propionibacteriaceae bacterium]|nr:DUF4282 domain-containing protein [Propionibacteriaceae bacterium]
MTTQPREGFAPSQPLYAQQLIPGWEERKRRGGGATPGSGGGSFGDAFEFSFSRYATPGIAKLIYVIVVVLCALEYVGAVMLAFASFSSDQVMGTYTLPSSPVPGFIALFTGWIPALLQVLGVRLLLEHLVATVRTAVDARALRSQYVGAPVE